MTDETDELQSLMDDCKAIYTEYSFTSRWAKIEGYHKLGERICQSPYKNNREILSRVTISTGIKERNIYRAIQFFEKCKDLDALPYGKDITWKKICDEYLPKPKDKKGPEMCTCPVCGKEHRKETANE